LSCNDFCSHYFDAGTQVTLSITPDPTSLFLGWNGACSGTAPCTVTVDADKTITASFTTGFLLSAHVLGNVAAGMITSIPAGINCGTDCYEAYPTGSQVTLTATPAPGTKLNQWYGCDTVSGNTCMVSMSAAKDVSASFIFDSSLTVVRSGTGYGTVLSDPAGINCGQTCTMFGPSETLVTLQAIPDAGFVFTGWSGGGCSGIESCQLTLSSSMTVTARFDYAATTGPAAGGKGHCFIATAAYGSYLDPHVNTLRTFRDRWLLTNMPGRILISLYYRYSPPVAVLIERNKVAQFATRIILTPLVYVIEYPLILIILITLAGGALFWKRPEFHND
jgi:hypothetical protein